MSDKTEKRITKSICLKPEHIEMIDELKEKKYSNLSRSQIICIAIESLYKGSV